MLKLERFLILLLVSLLVSCDDNPMEPNDASSFLPLTNGTKWYYRQYTNFNDSLKFNYPDKEYDLTYEVIGTTDINEKSYSILEITYYDYSNPYNPISIDTNYCRTEGTNLFWWVEDSNQYLNWLYVDFSIAEGDTFHFNWRDNITYVATVKKKAPDSVTIYYDIPGGADDEFEVTFLKNVGLKNTESIVWRLGRLLTRYELK